MGFKKSKIKIETAEGTKEFPCSQWETPDLTTAEMERQKEIGQQASRPPKKS